MHYLSRISKSYLSLILLFVVALIPALSQAQTRITVRPGQDLGRLAQSYPEGTIFTLSPGIYREQDIRPRNGQQFIGQTGAVLNGSRVLNNWFYWNGYWVHRGLPEALYAPKFEGSYWHQWREDLFINHRPLERVASFWDVKPGQFYFDHTKRELFIRDDPRNKLVEYGVTGQAFDGYANNIVIQNIVVEKYASRGQTGALNLQNTRNARVINVTARRNHGMGLRLGANTFVSGGAYVHNGQLGIGGGQGYIGAHGSVIERAEVAYNNYAGFNTWWEAGGIKILHSHNVTIRHNNIHHNYGQGVWFDWENKNIHVHHNHIHQNEGIGLQYEVSTFGFFEKNFFEKNATNTNDVWFWGANILVQNSQYTRVMDNVVVVEYGDGIGLTYQDRGTVNFGYTLTKGNWILRNKTYYLRDRGRNDPATSGNGADFDFDNFYRNGDNHSDWNTYYAPDSSTFHWSWNDKKWISRDWLHTRGDFEAHGTFHFVANPRAYAPTSFQQAIGVPLGASTTRVAATASTQTAGVSIQGVAAGAVLPANGFANFTTRVTGITGIQRVTYYRNGHSQCVVTTAPYTCRLQIWGAGDQLMQIVAVDSGGREYRNALRFKTAW